MAHMAVALGAAACEMGIGVRFFTVSELVLRLIAASAEGRLDRVLGDIMKSDLVILDEFGYVPIDRDGARLLFQVVSECHGARSLVITTNAGFSRWGSILTDDQMAAAMTGRIAHHGHPMVFEGESYRMRNALMRQQ
jgi:DNA replication protein DnaC